MVGAIEIGDTDSSFDVAANVAARFEKLVRRPDPRDPRLRIVRAESYRGSTGRAGRGDHAKPRATSRPKRRFVPKGKGRR
jgi:hypothetical protein